MPNPELGPVKITPEQAQRICCDMPIAFAAVSREGRFLWVNDHFCRIMERTEGELLGTTWQALTYPPDLEIDQALANQLLSGQKTGYTLIKAFKLKGHSETTKRLVYGTLTMWRHPVDGEFEYFLKFFQPFGVGAGPVMNWNTREIAAFLKENWRWMLLAGSTVIGLATGSTSFISYARSIVQESTQQEQRSDGPDKESSQPSP